MLRHIALIGKMVLPSHFVRRDGLSDVMVEYVIECYDPKYEPPECMRRMLWNDQ